jgi:hypothetical protein
MQIEGIRLIAIYDQNPANKNAAIFAMYAYFIAHDSPNQALYCWGNDLSNAYSARATAALAGSNNVKIFGREGNKASLNPPKPFTWFTLAPNALPGQKAKLQVNYSATQQVVFGTKKSFFTIRFKYDPGPMEFEVQFEGDPKGLLSGYDGHLQRIADGAFAVANKLRTIHGFGISLQPYTSPVNAPGPFNLSHYFDLP